MAAMACGRRWEGVRPWMGLLLVFLALYGSMSPVDAVFKDNLPEDDLLIPGDIMLGGLIRLYWPEPNVPCGSNVSRVGVQVAAAMQYTIDAINRNNSILPGLSLGLVILNDCDRPSVALARAAKFAPLRECYLLDHGCSKKFNYKVVGVMGPYSSPMSMAVASFLGLYNIPVMSWSASSPELSKGEKYKYFARAMPSDEHTIETIVDVLKEFKWTYVSLLTVAGTRQSAALFRHKIKQHNDEVKRLKGKQNTTDNADDSLYQKKKYICIALEKELNVDDLEQDYDRIVKKLNGSDTVRMPRVVLAFLNGKTTDELLKALKRNQLADEFIFIGLDGFQPNLATELKGDLPLKAITFNLRNGDPEFGEYYVKKNPLRNENKDVWKGEYTSAELNCITNGNKNNCSSLRMNDVGDFQLYNGIGRVTAIVKTYAYALHNLIEDNCPNIRSEKSKINDCIEGDLLFRYMLNTSFMAHGSLIEYDSKGDVYGDYVLTFTWGNQLEEYKSKLPNSSEVRVQSSKYSEADFGTWHRKNRQLNITWGLLPWNTDSFPDSVCSSPCPPGEREEQLDEPCCWECKRCRPNEKVSKNKSRCEKCPEYHWPTEDYSSCEEIIPIFMPHSALEIACALFTLAILGLASVGVITGLFIKHWERKVVKGCTRELMVPIMMGLVLGYLTVCAFLIPPSKPVCYISYVGFHLSLCLLFGPLFLKTKRVHMIFQASDKCKQRVKLADSKSLVMGLFLLVSLQIMLVSLVIGLSMTNRSSEIDVLKDMRSIEIRTVEERCHLENWVLLTPLCYNILLLILCAVYGFLTRKLPENYNESWYIFIAVTTTIFVWIACIPTYLVSEQAKFQVSLLSMALIVNGAVISVCLFVPKIYAVYNVPERDIRISRLGSRRLSMAVGENETMNNRSR